MKNHLDPDKSYWLTHSTEGVTLSMTKETIIEFEVELESLYQKLRTLYSDSYIKGTLINIDEFFKNSKDGK